MDIVEEKAQSHVEKTGETSTGQKALISYDNYWVARWFYSSHPTGTNWTKTMLTDDWLNSANTVKSQMDILKNSTDLSLVGNDVVDGVDCYVIRLTPDISVLLQYLVGQAESEYYLSQKEQSVKSIWVRQWYAKNNYRLMKTETSISMKIRIENTSNSSVDSYYLDFKMTQETQFFNFNETVDVNLPEDALNAKEVTQP